MKVILDSSTKILPLVNKSIAIILGLIDENNAERERYIDKAVEKEAQSLWYRLGIRLSRETIIDDCLNDIGDEIWKYERKEMKYDKAIKMLFSLQHRLYAAQNLLSDESHRIELDGEELGLIQSILDGKL